MSQSGLALSAGLVCLLFHACANTDASKPQEQEPQLVQIPVTIETEAKAVVFQAEVADEPDERTKGLMYRESMDPDHGMIFIFPEERQLSFWMKNTLIPLDMIFIKADHTILGVVENATPKTTTSRRVEGDSQYVLEINGGLAKQHGIKAGQTVSFYTPGAER